MILTCTFNDYHITYVTDRTGHWTALYNALYGVAVVQQTVRCIKVMSRQYGQIMQSVIQIYQDLGAWP